MILFCNLMCIYVHKICEDKFGSCKKNFMVTPWVGQKVNQKCIDGHDADDSGMDLCPLATG